MIPGYQEEVTLFVETGWFLVNQYVSTLLMFIIYLASMLQ